MDNTERYDLEAYISRLNSIQPPTPPAPVIGITANHHDSDTLLGDYYWQQVVAAGGVPVIIPPAGNAEAIMRTLDTIDALVLSGGADFNPLWAGEEPSPYLHHINDTRDLPELLITRLAYERQMPMLGICRGIQTLVMALHGEVEQDIYHPKHATTMPATLRHSQDADRWVTTHTIAIQPQTMLHNIYQGNTISVNSFHHQAVRAAGPLFRVAATSPDGVIEAIESTGRSNIIGVQWHPECLGKDGLKLFEWLVSKAQTKNV